MQHHQDQGGRLCSMEFQQTPKALAVTGALLIAAALDLAQQGLGADGALLAAAGAVPVIGLAVFVLGRNPT